jgi:hypothetical protein
MRQISACQLPSAPVRVIASHRIRMGLAALIAACCFMLGCAKPKQPVYEEPPQPQPPPADAAARPQEMPKLPPPKSNEVQEAVRRVFNDAALIDVSHKPNFIAGDFNGDFSQDIAVVLKPAPGKLSEMNAQYPMWMLKDPFVPIQPRMPPLRVVEDEVLLAVIHGYGPEGWRNPEATQTYLLKNAVGSGLKTHRRKDVAAANRDKKLPRLQGDLIGELLKGVQGYLYYTGPTYAWYDPKTFKGEPEKPLVHGRAKAGM